MYTGFVDQPSPELLVDHPEHILDPIILNVKGHRSINKQFVSWVAVAHSCAIWLGIDRWWILALALILQSNS